MVEIGLNWETDRILRKAGFVTGVCRRRVRLISLPDIFEEEEMVGGEPDWLVTRFSPFSRLSILGLISYSPPPDSLPPERYE